MQLATFSAVITTPCVPSAWYQGVVVHLPKAGDTVDCSTCRPLVLLPVVDKLFAKLLSQQIAHAVCLHDQDYAFRPGRGTLNLLQNLLAVVRQRTQANTAMHACIFYAAKAFDSVPHAPLLHRLLQCCIVGPVLAILLAMYSSASTRVRVGAALSPAFAVQRGAAQGCPLSRVPTVRPESPMLYAIFIYPVLQDMQTLTFKLSHPDVMMLWVGPVASCSQRSKAYSGLYQRSTPKSRAGAGCSTCPKSVVMVFGKRSGCARLDAPELWWGACCLPTADTGTYLRLVVCRVCAESGRV